MNILRVLVLSIAASVSVVGLARADDKIVKLGNLNDMTGPYADLGGPNSTVAAQMAVEDSGLLAKGWKIDIIAADHQNKPDVGANIARQWYDVEGVDAIFDTPNSGVALAVISITKDKNRVFLGSSVGSADVTGKACTPNTVHWTYDTYMIANGSGKAITKAVGDSWFFLTADYTFGYALERDTVAAVQANGGKVLGKVRHPLNNADFSSFLLQAQASGAKVIGLADAGADTSNAIKQAGEFGLMAGGQILAPLLLSVTDIHALGLEKAQGLIFTDSFYWDQNDQTRAFADRYQKRVKNGYKPSMGQAGSYAAVLHYLKALDSLGGNPHDGAKVVARMKEMPTDDPLFGKGMIRIDGRMIHPAYLYQVKTPAESKYPWDYYKLIATIPADEAFRPLAQSECPMVKN